MQLINKELKTWKGGQQLGDGAANPGGTSARAQQLFAPEFQWSPLLRGIVRHSPLHTRNLCESCELYARRNVACNLRSSTKQRTETANA